MLGNPDTALGTPAVFRGSLIVEAIRFCTSDGHPYQNRVWVELLVLTRQAGRGEDPPMGFSVVWGRRCGSAVVLPGLVGLYVVRLAQAGPFSAPSSVDPAPTSSSGNPAPTASARPAPTTVASGSTTAGGTANTQWGKPVQLPKPSFDSRPTWTGDRVAAYVHLGMALPAGCLGLSLDLSPWPYIVLNGGAGWGAGGPQWAVTPRVRLPLGRQLFLTVGGGISAGRYVHAGGQEGIGAIIDRPLSAMMGGGDNAPQIWDRADWTNLELGLDVLPAGTRLVSRGLIGLSTMRNRHDFTCQEEGDDRRCDRTDGTSLVYVGGAVGLAL